MDYSSYVPEVVRVDIQSRIYGDSNNRQGWSASLASAENSLRRADANLAEALSHGNQYSINELRVEKAQAQEHRDGMASEVACLNRLAHDARMESAYTTLSKEFTTDDQWRNFTHAAWAARVDYSKFRNRKKQAELLANEIANAAENLANMLSKFHSTGICGPGELSSIPALLEATDNHDMDNRNLHMWRSMRRHVLGRDAAKNDSDGVHGALGNESLADNRVNVRVKLVALKVEAVVDTATEARNMLRYAWGTAPSLNALLGTVARAAREFTVNESGAIGAALKKRQSNPSTEYIRAFAHLLFDMHRFQLSSPLMNAMAIVATVVINDPQVDVSYDDVRKSILVK